MDIQNLATLTSAKVACDTETTGLDGDITNPATGVFPARAFAFSFTTYQGYNFYESFPVDPWTRRVRYDCNPAGYERLVKFYTDKSITKIFHNANFDLTMLHYMGIEVQGPIYDTLIMAHCENGSRKSFGLKPLTKELFDIPDDDLTELKESVKKARLQAKHFGWAIADSVEADYHLGDPELVCKYACTDTERTMGLWYAFEDMYTNDSEYKALVDKEHKLRKVLFKMERRGIRLSLEKAEELKVYYNKIITDQSKLKESLGYGYLNPNSPKQMQEVFYGKLGMQPVFKVRKNKAGERTKSVTTDSSALLKWSRQGNALATALIELSAANTQLNTFVIPFTQICSTEAHSEGVYVNILHPNYKQSGPITGRLACTKPNLMNVSSNSSGQRHSAAEYRVRECFIPRPGHVLYFPDYSQIEIWGAAFRSQDPVLTQLLLSGEDMHKKTAVSAYGDEDDFETNYSMYRKMAKTINFACQYDAGPARIAEQLAVPFAEGQRLHDVFWQTYAGLKEYRATLISEIKSRGYIINAFGRKHYVDRSSSYKALNYDIQGSCADVIKGAMINIVELFETKFNDAPKLLLTIHDELCIEVPKLLHGKKFMRSCIQAMQGDFHTNFNMPIPFGVSMSVATENWATKKEATV